MSTYASTFTGFAPGGFDREHPDRFLDVAYDLNNPEDIRLTITTTMHTGWEDYEDEFEDHPTHTEARELALRLLIAIGTPHDLIEPLLALQEADPDAPRDTNL
jgi:hypothetical protein